MLSADQIADALNLEATHPDRLTVVPKPDDAALRDRAATSIDLRLGRWFRAFKQTRAQAYPLAVVHADATDDPTEVSRTKQHFVPFGKKFVLHPGRFVLGATLEWLQLPGSLSGYVTGKSSLGRHGLVIETAAGIHPHFSGCLTLELANVGEVPLAIYPGMTVCQVFLHRTESGKTADLGMFSGRRKPVLSPPKPDEIFSRLSDA
ncbi:MULTISPECIES: dCTP deaminase [Brevundimonas]|uniref:dCTP deaminase n=1 Tax=Brevundimonas TaxID=41275 RepID=UPI0005ED0113|nr:MULTISPECIES: dCTP deaminase [Brevundimonas]